ncbi:MAG: HEAT repeat domain-containing protein, partial [Candidatus Hodarchaeales archaeon]|jgi:HEAT repeat protein
LIDDCQAIDALIDEAAIEALSNMLKAEDRRVRRLSAEILDKVGWRPNNAIMKVYYFLAKKKWNEIENLGSIAVPPLINCLNDADYEVRSAVIKTLGRIGDPRAIAPLAKQYDEGKYAFWRDDEDNDEDEAWDEDAFYSFERAILDALAAIGDLQAIKAISNLLTEDNDSEGLSYIAEDLAASSDQKTIETLIIVLGDEDFPSYFRGEIACGLVANGEPRAVPALISALANVAAADWLWESADEALRKLGKPGVAPLIGLLTAENSRIRSVAVWALGVFGDGRAVDPLIERLAEDEEREVRKTAAEALGDLGECRAVESLIVALTEDEEREVRESAAMALGAIGDNRATKPLIERLADEERGVREQAAWALGALGDSRTIDPLIGLLTKEDRGIRVKAVNALQKIGDARAVDPLITALKDEEGDVSGTIGLLNRSLTA